MIRPRRVHLLPPVSYQGGKRRQAPEIVRHMALDPETPFYDLCCGSGAVSLELISRGHNPAKITMVDAGPWGDVWRLVGAGHFDLRTLWIVAKEVDVEPEKVPEALSALSAEVAPDHPLSPYVFLLLQSGSFGGKPIGVRRTHGWRTHGWYPVSHPRSWCPEPSEVLMRMRQIVQRARGVIGVRGRVEEIRPPQCGVAYFDPPYQGTSSYSATAYGGSLVGWEHIPTFVSELRPLAPAYRVLKRRVSTGVSGKASSADSSEYLSLFNADWPTPDVEKWEAVDLFEALAGEENSDRL